MARKPGRESEMRRKPMLLAAAILVAAIVAGCGAGPATNRTMVS